jgi:hypothetical protein
MRALHEPIARQRQDRQREAPPAGWHRFNDHVFLPPEANASVNECIAEAVREILADEGLQAFEMPKSAALAHEVGHCIVGAHEGLCIVEVKVFERDGAWCGITNESSNWHIDPDNTPTKTALGRARYLAAGLAGEAVLDPENLRRGSSLNELVLVQMLCAGIWQQRRAEFGGVHAPEVLWQSVWRQTCCIIKRNENVAHGMMRKLERSGRLYGKPLAASLRRVSRASDACIAGLVRALKDLME